MNIRYQKNIDEILTEEIQNLLLTKNIAVIGCGGQGGYTLEYLARLGVKSIVFWDGDCFDESNINRQIGCLETSLGQNKAKVMFERLFLINSTIELKYKDWYFGEKDTDLNDILQVDFIFYAADCYYNISNLRNLIKKAIIFKNIPVIDYPATLLGGCVYIDDRNSLEHYDYQTLKEIEQFENTNNKNLNSQTAYKCALLAAEAVNQMVLYFANSKFVNINSELNINIYHHKYTQYDKYGIFSP